MAQKVIKEIVENEFARKHKVGSKVAGMKIVDMARDNEGNKYIILPLYDFAMHIKKAGEQCSKVSQTNKSE